MQLIKVPDHIIDKMERCERNFYWGTTPTHKRLHLLKWSCITQPKDSGGLGIQDLHTKNKALLASTAWRLFQSPTPFRLRHGLLWRPSRGDRINLFHDPWFTPGVSLRMLIEGPLAERETTLTVANML
ncbi:hypothetical protein RDI58_024752 [Solanum bulbocastanum]|uniref:Uncharacterized protein n=1 Tax=Solanum bulbocastanum TaxID=147425 RepID=A0AAN8SYU2_SOLBU